MSELISGSKIASNGNSAYTTLTSEMWMERWFRYREIAKSPVPSFGDFAWRFVERAKLQFSSNYYLQGMRDLSSGKIENAKQNFSNSLELNEPKWQEAEKQLIPLIND